MHRYSLKSRHSLFHLMTTPGETPEGRRLSLDNDFSPDVLRLPRKLPAGAGDGLHAEGAQIFRPRFSFQKNVVFTPSFVESYDLKGDPSMMFEPPKRLRSGT